MSEETTFRKVHASVDFPDLEQRVLTFWDSIDAFAASIDARSEAEEYTFYDGPPFATGSPHYGHLLQGVIKDIVPRFWTMRGYKVERRFGWDTHGLPVEMEVEKLLGVSGPRQIHEIGIATFNEACRSMVNEVTDDWQTIMTRLGRWVDFENDYKTMDTDFMESVWWVFGQLWEKGLIYQDFKVLPYSYGAATPLSNFEANLDYRDVDDPAITVALRITEGSGTAQVGDHLAIWTTTPWTLPGNLAVAVGNEIEYSRVLPADSDNAYWVASDRVDAVFSNDHTVTATTAGSNLVGMRYEPPFDYFAEKRTEGAFVVIASDHVTVDEGTGLVHMAPAYGEEDLRAFKEQDLSFIVDPVDAEARFTSEVPDVEGLNVKDADGILITLLKESGKLLDRSTIRHSYPFCWRTGTPLIYKAIPTWFVSVTTFRDRMVEINKDIRWVPESIGKNRFGNWIEDARDWAISRNRYWGSCIPVWICDGCGEQKAVASIDELFDLSGVRLDDLHRHFVDPVTWPCSTCDGTMVRVPEVLDCWFESGSMPYAQIHYPFENRERFEERFPADFIAEGLDQTRGWFYTLLILSTALRDQAPFENCIVTGMVLAEDGRKMSKSLKNYPDPIHILDDYGADALRAYLINSPIVRGEPLRFSEDGVKDVVRTVLLPLWNSYSFFTTYAAADNITADDLLSAPPIHERPEIDRWIISVMQSLISDVNREMEAYRLFAVVPPIIDFVGDLTNWYIRRSRRRFWAHRGTTDNSDKMAAFATLHEVLVLFSRVSAPFIPFISEEIYQGLARTVGKDVPVSVHLTDFPVADRGLIDEHLERSMFTVRSVVNLGRGLRKQQALRVRQPLASVTVVTRSQDERNAVLDHIALIRDELNVKSVEVHADEVGLVDVTAKANFKALGPRYGSETKTVAAVIETIDQESIASILDGDALEVDGFVLTSADIIVARTAREGTVVATEGSISVALETELTDALRTEGAAREIVNRIQSMRRNLDLTVTEHITVSWQSSDSLVIDAFDQHRRLIAKEVLADDIVEADTPDSAPVEIDQATASISIQKVPLSGGTQERSG